MDLREGREGDCLRYLERGGDKKDFKKRGQAGSRGGHLKNAGW